MCIKYILIVIDERRIGRIRKPLPDGVALAHGLGVEHENASLEVIVRILHLQYILGVSHAFAMLDVEVGKEINISNRAEQLAL